MVSCTTVTSGIGSRSRTADRNAVCTISRGGITEVAAKDRSTSEIRIDLDGVVAEIAVGLVSGAFGNPESVVRSTTGNGGGVQRSSEAKGVVAALAVDLGRRRQTRN